MDGSVVPERFGYLSEEQAWRLARRRAGVARARHARRRRKVAAALALSLGVLIWALLTLWPSGSGPSVSVGTHRAAPSPTAAPARLAPSRPAAPPADARARRLDRLLAASPLVASGGRRRREIALTFDDGPGPDTAAVMRVLRRWHATATFFEIGTKVQTEPATVAAQARAGFAIEDHTVNHRGLGGLPAAAQRAEIHGSAQRLRRAGAPYPRLFRPPYGRFDKTTVATARSLGMLTVLWTLDSRDYLRPGSPAIVNRVLRGAVPGAIVLMHDGGGDRAQTVAALPRIIARLRHRGYRLVTVRQLLQDDPPPRGQARLLMERGG